MKNRYIIFALLSCSILISSCTAIGIQHYYKTESAEWLALEGTKEYAAVYGYGGPGFPVVKWIGKDSFELNNIYASTDNRLTHYAIGICYIPVFPTILPYFFSYQGRYFLGFNFTTTPYNTKIKIDEIKFYINGDSVDSKPVVTHDEPNSHQFYYDFDIKTTNVNKVLINFNNVSINNIKINIHDLVLERKWKFFDSNDIFMDGMRQ